MENFRSGLISLVMARAKTGLDDSHSEGKHQNLLNIIGPFLELVAKHPCRLLLKLSMHLQTPGTWIKKRLLTISKTKTKICGFPFYRRLGQNWRCLTF
jgi:hypothetical protein